MIYGLYMGFINFLKINNMFTKIEDFYKSIFPNIRNIEKMNTINYGNRSLFESVVNSEVLLALKDWKNNNASNYVLIGGIALSYYVKPRFTQDVDILFLSKNDIPNTVNKFKKHRPNAFQHNKTHVEIEVFTSEFISIDQHIVNTVFETSNIIDGIKVASIDGLIALKLNRFKLQDQADIEALIEYSIQTNFTIDLTKYNLSENLLNKFQSIKQNFN